MNAETLRLLANALPVCASIKDSPRELWGILWNYLYLDHDIRTYYPVIASAPEIQKEIVRQCQLALDTGCFEVDEVQLEFRKHGFGLSVRPGDACSIFVSDDFYTHNIDSADQCYALQGFFIIMLHEILEIISFWQDNPTLCIEGEPEDRSYRIERSIESYPYKLWQEFVTGCDASSEDSLTLVWARTHQEAVKLLDSEPFLVTLLDEDDKIPLCNLEIFEVKITYQDAALCPSVIYRVLATNPDHAQEMVEKMVANLPSFSPVDTIRTLNEDGETIEPMIFNKVFEP